MDKLNASAVDLAINLPIIRAFAGWSGDDLARMLGISRITMIRLEKQPSMMKELYFLAIKALIYEESEVNVPLKDVLNVLFYGWEINGLSRDAVVLKVNELRKTVGKKRGCAALKEEVSEWYKSLMVKDERYVVRL